jgi:positive regulator of sigma E activity
MGKKPMRIGQQEIASLTAQSLFYLSNLLFIMLVASICRQKNFCFTWTLLDSKESLEYYRIK